jgi:hypothetical protein
MATSGDLYMATSGDFFMATDTESGLRDDLLGLAGPRLISPRSAVGPS